MVPTNDMERCWDDEIFICGGKPARVAKELKSMDEDPDFQPTRRTVATTGEPDWAELFAICCTTSVSTEVSPLVFTLVSARFTDKYQQG